MCFIQRGLLKPDRLHTVFAHCLENSHLCARLTFFSDHYGWHYTVSLSSVNTSSWTKHVSDHMLYCPIYPADSSLWSDSALIMSHRYLCLSSLSVCYGHRFYLTSKRAIDATIFPEWQNRTTKWACVTEPFFFLYKLQALSDRLYLHPSLFLSLPPGSTLGTLNQPTLLICSHIQPSQNISMCTWYTECTGGKRNEGHQMFSWLKWSG